MNLKIILITILFSFGVVSAYGQNSNVNVVVYKAIKLEHANEKKVQELNFLYDAIQSHPVEFEFTFDHTKSLYKVIDKAGSDNLSKRIAQTYFGANYVYYTDLKAGESICQSDFVGDFFLYPQDEIAWTITKESKKIGNYTCFKATSLKTETNNQGEYTKEVIAWYTPQISTRFGPFGYHGLPGLIIELQEGERVWVANSIVLNKASKKQIEKPTKGVQLSSAQELLEIVMKASNERRP